MSYVLKTATESEIEIIVALDKLCFGGIWSADGYRREIDSPNSSLLLLWLQPTTVTNTDSMLVGLGCLWSIVEEAHITLLGIHPQHRRMGLGRLLLCALLQDAVARELERATLEVKASNHTAISLYQQYGFKTAGRRKNYYPTGEDALILWRDNLHQPDFTTQLQQWQQDTCDRYSIDLS